MNKQCETCKGTGWTMGDKGIHDEGFGKLVPCRCNLEAASHLASLKPAPKPEPSPAELRWIEYTE